MIQSDLWLRIQFLANSIAKSNDSVESNQFILLSSSLNQLYWPLANLCVANLILSTAVSNDKSPCI